MTDDNKQHNIAEELVRSRESLQAARLLTDAGLLHDAQSRMYYGIYHASVALLLTLGIEPCSHSGVVSLLGRHFIRTGRLPPEDGRLFARIQKYRIEADYGHDFVITDAMAEEDLESCEEFCHRVRALISAARLAVSPP